MVLLLWRGKASLPLLQALRLLDVERQRAAAAEEEERRRAAQNAQEKVRVLCIAILCTEELKFVW